MTSQAISKIVESIIREARFPRRHISEDVSRAIDHIQLKVTQNLFAPGDKLVETDLAEEIGVGRGRIREALRILSGEGLVVLKANQGARIRTFSPTELAWGAEAGGGILNVGVSLFLRDYAEMPSVSFRALTFSHKRISPGNRDALEVSTLITDYHLVVNYYTGNKYLNRLVSNLHTQHHTIEMAKYLTVGDTKQCVELHYLAHQCLLDGDKRAMDHAIKINDVVVKRLRSVCGAG